MGSETDAPIETITIRKVNADLIVEVLRHTYNGGYSSKQLRLTFEDRKALRAKAYRGLKALGAEK